MSKIIKTINVQLSINIFKDGKRYIADCPPLELSTHGATVKEAKKNFDEALKLWLECVTERGTLREALAELGWKLGPIPTPKETVYDNVNIHHLIQNYSTLCIPCGAGC